MKLLLMQTDIRWQEPRVNRTRAEAMIMQALEVEGKGEGETQKVDLIVLPEMFTTGFAADPTGAAEAEGGAETLEWMRTVARSHDAAVTGSVAIELDGEFRNRLFFVRPDGSHDFYDKRHLFSPSGEHRIYTPGRRRVVVEWRGWRILLMVCYDLRFPVFSRNHGDYDMAIYAANWPTARQHPWSTLLRARAIENVAYVAGVNRVGGDPFTSYAGQSALIDFRGHAVDSSESESNPNAIQERAFICEADIEALRAFRKKFPSLDDADDFKIVF